MISQLAKKVRLARVLPIFFALSLPNPPLLAAEYEEKVFRDQCGSCHNLAGPKAGDFETLARKPGPDLYYAGNKFQRDWLQSWLQQPSPVRYSDTFFLNHLVTDYRDDYLRGDSLSPHPRLDSAAASLMSDLLMARKVTLPDNAAFDDGRKYRLPKASYLVRKKQACVACHRITWGKRTIGGVSGPDLSTAGRRLNPDWVLSYVSDPRAWNPQTLMPKTHADEDDLMAITFLLTKQVRQGSRGDSGTISVQTPRDWPRPEELPGPDGMREHPANNNYRRYCVQCHGRSGDGRGINDSARGMSVSPKSHTANHWLKKLSDSEITQAIADGGLAVGKSSLMPGWKGALSKDEIDDLVEYIRLLCKCRGPS